MSTRPFASYTSLAKRFIRSGVLAALLTGSAAFSTVATADAADAVKPPAPPAPPANIDELKSRIEKILHDTKTPGVGIAIVNKDGPEWIGGLGLADVAAGKLVTEDTLFRIGSTSKMFVALSVLKLQHEGKLDLQDTLRSRTPDLKFENPWEKTDPVRIVHLLEHTAGWTDMALREYAYEAGNEVTLQQGLAFNPGPRKSRWKPGTRWSYTNQGPPAAAYVIEKITNQRFEDYVGQNWFKPLRMGTADYFDTPEVQSRLAKLYRSDGNTPYPYWHILLRPSGSINASAKEMANVIRFYLNRGEFEGVQLLPRDAIDRMERPSSTYAVREGVEAGYGLNNYVTVKNGRIWHGHGGGVSGGLTDLSYQLDAGAGYIIMINSSKGKALSQVAGLIQAYLTRSLPQPFLPPPVETSDTVKKEYTGWYEPINPRTEMSRFVGRIMGLARITVTPNGLKLRPLLGKQQDFFGMNDRLFRREKDPIARLALISPRSEGTLIQVDGVTLRRVSSGLVWTQLATIAVALLLAVSSVVFALVWVPRKLFGRMKGVKHLSVRALPVLAIVSIAVTIYALKLSSADAIPRLGRMTPWSVAVCVSTAGFALFAVLGLVQVLRHRQSEVKRWVWWHSFGVSLFLTIIAAYLAYWGMIGFRSWA